MANNFPNLLPSLNIDLCNGIYVDSRVTFTRAGTRTYYGQEVVKAEENLFIRSQEFSNAAWLIDAVTLSTVTAPDGTSTASKMLPTAVSAAHYIYGAASNKPKLASTTYTKSVRIKADGYGFATVSIAGTSSAVYVAATFDLSGAGAVTKTGVGGSGGTLVGSSITALADGWYQCTVTGSVTQAAGFDLISVATTGTPTYGNYGLETFTGDGTSAIQIWGAQIEQRSFATAYTATTTQPITRYQRQLKTAAANEWPREFDPVTGECLGRSVWESRTNLLTYSEDFTNAAWTKTRSSILANQIIAPDGTLTADKLIENTDNNTHTIQAAFSPLASTSYTYSAYIKASERTFALIQSNIGGTNTFAIVNLTTGAVGSVTGTGVVSTTATGNGWYRVSISAATTTTASGNVFIYTAQDATTFSYTGDGYSGIYIWGAQLEAGAFASPYTPTVAAQVTRVADSAVMTGVNFSSWYRQDEGAFFVDSTNSGTSGIPINIHDGTANNQYQVLTGTSGTAFLVSTANVIQANIGTRANPAKTAASYKFNDFMASTNGSVPATDTSGTLPLVSVARIGSRYDNSNHINGYIKRLTYYPQALTSANLTAVTR